MRWLLLAAAVCGACGFESLRGRLEEDGLATVDAGPSLPALASNFVAALRRFNALDPKVKRKYKIKESFGFLPDKKVFPSFTLDSVESSFYAQLPDNEKNRWPEEVDLKTPFLALASIMKKTAERAVSALRIPRLRPRKIECLARAATYLSYPAEKRSLPWCGPHADHTLVSVLLPAFYFLRGEQAEEPVDAGLKYKKGETWRKVGGGCQKERLVVQAGEWAQILTNDTFRASQHMVDQPQNGDYERITMVLFCVPSLEEQIRRIHSRSELAREPRFCGGRSGSCFFSSWHGDAFRAYLRSQH